MNMENETNKVEICGTIVSDLKFSHEVLGESFYECFVQSNRLSGKDDILPLILSDRIGSVVKKGDRVVATGQLRSYNKFDENLGRSKLILSVFVRDICMAQNGEDDRNQIFLHGYLCKMPVYRTTPFHREICDLLLACNRAYQKSDYIPIIAWGRNARLARDGQVGDEIEIVGRLQSREYIKQTEAGAEERTAYEVSASQLFVNFAEKN